MLPAIRFDNQASGDTCGVGDVRSDRVLPAEFESLQAPSTEQFPKLALNIGRVSPQKSGITACHAWHSACE
jgi:hypothetical protein